MAYQFENIRMLVIEDNKPMLSLVKSLLLALGVGDVFGAEDGEEGFEIFRREDPDIVIADWLMKPVDGISFTKRVRTDPLSPNPYAPVILMTGFSEKARVMEARDAGVTEFLVKPFTTKELYRRLAQIIERPRQFVRSEDFFGPDRRRHRAAADEDFAGPYRREADREILQRMKQKEQKQEQKRRKAHEVIKDIRDREGLKNSDPIDKLD